MKGMKQCEVWFIPSSTWAFTGNSYSWIFPWIYSLFIRRWYCKNSGRLTLNPIKHIDLIGFIFLLIFRFGWAKPVPINPLNFKNRRKGIVIVSLSGPFSNFLVAFIILFIISLDVINNYLLLNILFLGLWYNMMLGIFNLLPFPPLDGSKILASLLPRRLEYYFYKYEKYLYLILIILLFTDLIDRILTPMINFSLNILLKIIS